MELVDTHCHIQEIVTGGDPDDIVQSKWAKAGLSDPVQVINEAQAQGVSQFMVVGCSLSESKRAIELAKQQPSCFASVGIHPHEAAQHTDTSLQHDFAALASLPEVHAIGECGLDYFYNHSPRVEQVALLKFQLDLAKQHNLPVIFHVREAFDDFWPIFDEYRDIRGVLHSYTDNLANLEKALERGLYVGLNGIMTFTKDKKQLEMAREIPLQSLVVETDAPFLTPKPYRGKVCVPKHVVETARFLSDLRGESFEEFAAATTINAKELFRLL